MSLINLFMVVIGAIGLIMGLLSRRWKQPTWKRQTFMGILNIVLGFWMVMRG